MVLIAVAKRTVPAQGNACYLLANLLELGEAVMLALVALPGALAAVVGVVSAGSDFAMGNASRVLGNVVRESLAVAEEVAADGTALSALVAVVSGGRDKSRGNAAIALGTLCEDALADRAGGGLPALRAVAALRARVGALPGCLRALADAAVQCEPDVQAQAAIALSAVLAHDGANADALAALDEGDALYRLVELAAAPAHKAAQPANEALANVADVRDGSPAAAERLALMPGVLPLLVDVMMREDNDGGARPPSVPSPANPLGVSVPCGGTKDMVAATVSVIVAVPVAVTVVVTVIVTAAVAATLVPNPPPGPAAPHRTPPSRG